MNFAILDPKGWVSIQQKELIIAVVLLMLIAVLPVLFMTFFFAWKYKATNTNAKYSPNLDRIPKLQRAWVGLLVLIVIGIAITAFKSSHALDPRKEIVNSNSPVTIQAVALEWKWLFIYPEYDFASVNFIQFPEDTPVNFEITADAPMNSLWIPQLGGQMYAMNGMKTKLSLMANEKGTYRGVSNNISGEGFAGMTFEAKASSKQEFDSWINSNKSPAKYLEYEQLAEPSKKNPVAYYQVYPGLFDAIIMKFMSEHEHVR
jgi:cytochrome o ubiquinol oxidase subunit II